MGASGFRHEHAASKFKKISSAAQDREIEFRSSDFRCSQAFTYFSITMTGNPVCASWRARSSAAERLEKFPS